MKDKIYYSLDLILFISLMIACFLLAHQSPPTLSKVVYSLLGIDGICIGMCAYGLVKCFTKK